MKPALLPLLLVDDLVVPVVIGPPFRVAMTGVYRSCAVAAMTHVARAKGSGVFAAAGDEQLKQTFAAGQRASDVFIAAKKAFLG